MLSAVDPGPRPVKLGVKVSGQLDVEAWRPSHEVGGRRMIVGVKRAGGPGFYLPVPIPPSVVEPVAVRIGNHVGFYFVTKINFQTRVCVSRCDKVCSYILLTAVPEMTTPESRGPLPRHPVTPVTPSPPFTALLVTCPGQST